MISRNSRARVASLILFTAFCLVRVPAQAITAVDSGLGGTNTISGTILPPNGGRMERRISVRLQTMTTGDRVTSTDDFGKFAFIGVPNGDYTIVIEKEKEFEPSTTRVSVIQPRGMPSQNYSLNIRLSLKSEKLAKSSVINVDLANVPKPALDLYNKAVELRNNGDHVGAIEQLNAAIAAYPDFMLAYNEMGVQYFAIGQLEKADAALKMALKKDPKAYMPMMNRGMVLYTMKRYAEAEPVLRSALAIKDGEAIPHYFLGHTLAYLGKFDEAEKHLAASIKLGGAQMREAHRLLAIIYGSRGDKKSEIASLEAYLLLVPSAPDAEQLNQLIAKLKTGH